MDERSISIIVEEVLRKLGPQGTSSATLAPVAPPRETASNGSTGMHGVFKTIDEAANAAFDAFQKFMGSSLETRKKIIDALRAFTLENKELWARLELDETKLGRYEHKIGKLESAATLTPGVEDLQPRVWSGDHGLTVEEYAPFGVIGAVTPVTHPIPTMLGNATSILAGGNTVVFNAHPNSKRIFANVLAQYNDVIYKASGFRNLLTCVEVPTIETGREMFHHPKVRVLLVTGGGAVVREALNTPKKAIAAGPGNPPVVVDETANIPKAAADIIIGAGFDYNLLCIGEKEVFVVNKVADQLIAEMKKLGCVQLSSSQIDALAQQAFKCKGDHNSAKGCAGTSLNRALVGRSPQVLAASIGLEIPADCPMLIGETSFENPWVQHEQMMMFLPIVRCSDVDQAIDFAFRAEHGYGHTAMIHSMNVATMTKMGKIMNCSIFVKNGPSIAGLGIGGEGYSSFSIAGPTGEGITSARTFCRVRRCALVDYLRVV